MLLLNRYRQEVLYGLVRNVRKFRIQTFVFANNYKRHGSATFFRLSFKSLHSPNVGVVTIMRRDGSLYKHKY
jgi:hypothetical protein